MTDLNTAIALSKGYQFGNPVQDMNLNARKIWFIVEEGFWREVICPDFEHDARLYMALYFELHVDVRMRLAISKPETFGHDVCVEYCKLKGIEVVG
jgi:hypothetical protein